MSVRVQVEALLSIIKEATYNALEQYETTGVLTPVLDSTEGHPLDQVDDNIALKKIISKLEGACEQLCTTLAPPSHTIMNRAQDYGWACLQVAVQLKLADELTDKPNGLHVDELAAKVNVNPMKLASILRVLAARHCFREVSPDVFANNRLSVNIISDTSLAALVDLIADDGQTPATLLPQYLVDPDYGQSLSMTKALYQYRRKDQGIPDKTFYERVKTDASIPDPIIKVMMKAMRSMNTVMGSQAALSAYPWNNVKSVCDVGSGLGAFSRSLLERFPDVRVVQFDLAPTIAMAEQQWNGAFADRNEFVSGDFLVDLPIKNCDVYYLRTILHNCK
ncbi:hypothetical protein D9619_008584 [Psilocybe cf. subviscida]|uniref:O-methyltransferase domain-containing protein n=1 Tax=Psilocybe cf. subviscida TaxID=2480587 RepID=A0A8H5F124_9AGAR|nr:hypothetical protein D9619_008584 [Psilocybe cf. subviscida]